MEILNQFKKIDAPWVLEVITERFSFLPIDIMTNRSIVYGGAVRDAIAGIALRGDLDIVVGPSHYKVVVNSIDSSARWSRVQRNLPRPSSRPRRSNKVRFAELVEAPRAAYPKSLPLKDITRFVNVRGAEIEIISAKYEYGMSSEEEGVIAVPAKVDIVCCGLAMDRSGDIYEIIESAYEDCKNRILRFNDPAIDIVDIPRLEERIKKLEKRGWKSEIKIPPLKKRQRRIKKLAEVEEAKKGKKKSKESEKSENLWGHKLFEEMAKNGKRLRYAEMYGGRINKGSKREPDPGPPGRYKSIPPPLRGRSAEWYEKRYNDLSTHYTKLMSDRSQIFTIIDEGPPLSKHQELDAKKRLEHLEHLMGEVKGEIDMVTDLMREAPKTSKPTRASDKWTSNFTVPKVDYGDYKADYGDEADYGAEPEAPPSKTKVVKETCHNGTVIYHEHRSDGSIIIRQGCEMDAPEHRRKKKLGDTIEREETNGTTPEEAPSPETDESANFAERSSSKYFSPHGDEYLILNDEANWAIPDSHIEYDEPEPEAKSVPRGAALKTFKEAMGKNKGRKKQTKLAEKSLRARTKKRKALKDDF